MCSSLLHWAVCKTYEARDILQPGRHTPQVSVEWSTEFFGFSEETKVQFYILQEYAMEALCKLSVKDENMDMVLMTGPWPAVERYGVID